MESVACILPDGKRLHLSHGPIDLVIGADGTAANVRLAYEAAVERFKAVLRELVKELPLLRRETSALGLPVTGDIAQRMATVVRPHWRSRVTPMAAVAGAVAEHMLKVLREAAPLSRCFVNNGGDIAIHLSEGSSYTTAGPVGSIVLFDKSDVRGIATSGWRGRSFSLGIADSVTVLSRTAAEADVAATLIANAVDIPNSGKIERARACDLVPDSDLKGRLVTVDVVGLDEDEILQALWRGLAVAERMQRCGFIVSAALVLQNHVVTTEYSTDFFIRKTSEWGTLECLT